MAYDEARTAVLEAYDLRVLRFTNPQIDHEFEAVCQTIQTEVITRVTQST